MVEPSLLVADVVEAPLVLLVPSPLASIGENRFCSALPDADVAAPVDDWLCASSSALKVVGDICPPPLNPGTAPVLPGAEAPPERPNRSAEAWLKPLDCADDEVEEVSDLIVSSAADAAPKSKQHGRTPRIAAKRGLSLNAKISKPRAIVKNPMK